MMGSFIKMVPEAGVEPAHLKRRQILSLMCLPIPPFWLICFFLL
jgi:hypothetical protein